MGGGGGGEGRGGGRWGEEERWGGGGGGREGREQTERMGREERREAGKGKGGWGEEDRGRCEAGREGKEADQQYISATLTPKIDSHPLPSYL